MGKSTETISAIVQFLTDRLDGDERNVALWDRGGDMNEVGRFMRDLAAKRSLIELHTEDWTDTGDVNLDAEICAFCREGWPCRTLCLLASIYSDHPDYREEWKP